MRMTRDVTGFQHCTAYLDGEKPAYCIEADEDEGWVRCAVSDGRGHILLDPDHPGEEVTEIRRGAVRLDFDPPDWRQVAEAAIALAKDAPNVELRVAMKGRG